MAVDPFEATDSVADTHPFQQGAHTLAVAMATSYNLNPSDNAISALSDHQF